MLLLDERQGLKYAFISIRPNTRIANPHDPAVFRSITEAIKRELKNKPSALKKFGAITHQRLFSHLSPRALAVVNKFN